MTIRGKWISPDVLLGAIVGLGMCVVVSTLWEPFRPSLVLSEVNLELNQNVSRLEDVHAFNIPPTRMGAALALYNDQSGLDWIWAGTTEGISELAPPVVGTMNSERAIELLLNGSGNFVFPIQLQNGKTVIQIKKLGSEPER